MEEDEIELMDFLTVIWKRKWIIIIPTLICILVAGIISYLLPKKWEIDAVIQPSKFLAQTVESQLSQDVFVYSKQIAEQINQRVYDNQIAAELNLHIREFPGLRAENIRDTKLVRVSIRESDVEKAKRILNSLFIHLKKELDEKADIEMKEIEAQIKANEIKRMRIEEDITAFRNMLNTVKKRKKEIEREIGEAKNRISLLEKEQRLSLKKESRSETESLAMLLYSNEIQQSLQYYNTLAELLSEKKIEEENINLEIGNREERIKQVENETNILNEKKRRIDFTKLIKEPTSSLSPVAPRKNFNVLLAGILSLVIFTIFAFFLEYIEKRKTKG